jgi:UDP-N-acetylmuramoyl-L-alanyl-D-glutamate--2,6-diaminopimelate ligase
MRILMKIKDLFRDYPEAVYGSRGEVEIENLLYDSRKAGKNDLFVALSGSKTDAHSFIPAVLEKGGYVVAQKNKFPLHERVIEVEDTRKALAILSKAYFGDPDQKLKVIGITGTNGKTTTTYMLKSILEEAGIRTGILGTIHYIIGEEVISAVNTTPESYEIYKLLAEMVKKDCGAVAMEISSHALSMHRVEGLALDAALFTNITQDHLDYHGTMENYLQAKLKIFKLLEKSPKTHKRAFFNKDLEYREQIENFLKTNGLDYQSFAIREEAQWTAVPHQSNIYHNFFSLHHEEGSFEVDCPMLGTFNVYNALGAAAAASFLGVSGETICRGLKSVFVKGRFEKVENSLGFAVIIDYAHTPDALENVILSARELKPINVITVFGAGGDRDRKKRPLMGRISRDLSNYTIITSDNPRSESPEAIIAEIETVFKSDDPYHVEPDRAKAIASAVEMAEEGDLVLIAGKGHEDYQVIGEEVLHFSDRETAEKYLKLRETGAGV